MSKSIKTGLIITVLASQILLAAGLLLTGLYDTQRRLLASLDAGLQAHAMSVAALVRYTEDATGNVYFDDSLLPESLDAGHPDVFVIWAARSGLLVRSSHWPQGLDLPLGGARHWNFTAAGVPYRGLRLEQVPILDREVGPAFAPQTLTIVYAAPTVQMDKQVREAGIFIAGSSLLLLGITAWLALWGIRRGLSPLQQLADQASLVSARHWELHLPAETKEIAELRPLSESMAMMLSRLQRSFAQQREFVGNAAHELKTPVAVLKSTLQSLLHRPRTAEEYRAGLEHSLEDLERLERLLQWMLRLARTEQWAHGALRPDLPVIELSATCEEAVERIRVLAEKHRNHIVLSSNAEVRLRADPEDMQMVWSNLLENAVRYSAEGSPVEFAIARRNGGPAEITVEDHGEGIREEDLPHIFERFYRGDPSRTRATGGFGLGLSIARAVVEAYGGTIRAESTPGKGTRMIVELPVETSPLTPTGN